MVCCKDTKNIQECNICTYERECITFPCCNNKYNVCIVCLENPHLNQCPQCQVPFNLEKGTKTIHRTRCKVLPTISWMFLFLGVVSFVMTFVIVDGDNPSEMLVLILTMSLYILGPICQFMMCIEDGYSRTSPTIDPVKWILFSIGINLPNLIYQTIYYITNGDTKFYYSLWFITLMYISGLLLGFTLYFSIPYFIKCIPYFIKCIPETCCEEHVYEVPTTIIITQDKIPRPVSQKIHPNV